LSVGIFSQILLPNTTLLLKVKSCEAKLKFSQRKAEPRNSLHKSDSEQQTLKPWNGCSHSSKASMNSKHQSEGNVRQIHRASEIRVAMTIRRLMTRHLNESNESHAIPLSIESDNVKWKSNQKLRGWLD
jgi:hypothetical protein